GIVHTEAWEGYGLDPGTVAGSMLLKRLQTPDEVAGVIAFCLSPAGDYITGTTIAADGGWDLVVEAESGTVWVEFIYQIIGRGTETLARLTPGDKVECLGPLGKSFDLGAAEGREVALVAGGAGSPALYILAAALVHRQIPTRLFLGGASRGDLCGLDDFRELLGADRVLTATIDGSEGTTGFVTGPLEEYLDSAGEPLIYACGPDPMLHRVAAIAAARNLPAQLSLEAPMACGYGICVGCAVPVRHECPEGFIYQKVCTDGPVFWSRDLAW
ncbi:MAG: SDR family oxidoreductase, partial [Acidobacteriota bacterium]